MQQFSSLDEGHVDQPAAENTVPRVPKSCLKTTTSGGRFFSKQFMRFFVAEMIHVKYVKDFYINDRGNVWSFRLSGALFVSFRFLLLEVNVDPFPHEKVKYHLRYFKDFFFVFFPDHFFQASYCKSWLGMI